MNSLSSFQIFLFGALVLSVVYLTVIKSDISVGTWDPKFTDTTGAALANVTFTGNFNRIGRMVFFCVNVQFADFSGLGSNSSPPPGGYQITLPYPARQTFTSRGGTLHNSVDTKYHIAGILDTLVDPTKSILKFYYSGSTNDLPWKYNTPSGWNTGSPAPTSAHFDISGFYEVA